MGQLDLCHLQDGFAALVKQADPEHLPNFFLWLDLKVSQFKISGNFIPDKELTIQKIWIQHATRRLFDTNEKLPKFFANGSGISAKNELQVSQDANNITSLKSLGDLPADGFQPVPHADSPRFDARCSRDGGSTSSNILDSDLHRVMLRVPILTSQEPCCLLEPLDFSCIEKKSRTEGKEAVRSLLREALCKTRNAVSTDAKHTPLHPVTDISVSEKQIIGIERETKSDENVSKMPDEPEKNSCPYCSKTFQYRSSYRRHVKIHQGIFSHMCYVCGRKFTRKEHYVRHKCNRRPNKPNRGQETIQDANSSIYQSDCQMSLEGIENPETTDLDDTKLSIKVESHEGDNPGEVTFLDDATDEEFGRLHESRRKSSTPRKLVIANDSPSDMSDTEASFVKKGANESFFSERSFDDDVSETLPNLERFVIQKSEDNCTDDGKDVHIACTPNGLTSSELIPARTGINNVVGALEKTGLGATPGFLNLQTGSYKVEEIDDDDTSDSGKAKVITIKKQAKYLKLKNEAHIVDGNLCFSCPHCFKTFHRSSNFSRHMRIHRGVYSYICQTCSRGFFRREHFQKHKCHRKSMSTVCDRRTKFELLHNNVESGDGSPPENSGDFGSWPLTSPYHVTDSGNGLLIPASLETQ